MARPKKNNALYYSHDADMRNDLRIKAVRNVYGTDGYGVWCMLLEVLTDSDYFEYELNDMTIEMLAADFQVTSEYLRGILEYLKKLQLICIEDEKLYSQKHKDRFETLLSKRDRDAQRISSYKKLPEQAPAQTPYKSPMSIEVNEIEDFLLNDVSWTDTVCMVLQIDKSEIAKLIKDFVDNLKISNIKSKTPADLFSHFKNWYFKQKEISKNGNNKRSKSAKAAEIDNIIAEDFARIAANSH